VDVIDDLGCQLISTSNAATLTNSLLVFIAFHAAPASDHALIRDYTLGADFTAAVGSTPAVVDRKFYF